MGLRRSCDVHDTFYRLTNDMVHLFITILFTVLIFMAIELVSGVIYAGIELITDIWLKWEEQCNK